MKNRSRLSLLLLIVLKSFFSFSQAQQGVEVVVSSGIVTAMYAEFSPDGKVLAIVPITDVVTFWDVKTGRLLRSMGYTLDNPMNRIDSIWFSSGTKTLFARLSYSNDQLKFDIENKNASYIKSETPFDYTKMYSTRMINASTNLYGAKKVIEQKATDGIHQLVFTPSVSRDQYKTNLYRISFKNLQTNKEIAVRDSSYYGWGSISPDSKYVFLGTKVYDFETGKVVSELVNAGFSSMSVMFMPGTDIPVTCSSGGIRSWDFPNVKPIMESPTASFFPDKDYKKIICDVYDAKGLKKAAVLYNLETQTKEDSVAIGSRMRMVGGISAEGNKFFTSEYKQDPKATAANFEIQVYDLKKHTYAAKLTTSEVVFTPGGENLFLKDYASFNSPDSCFKTYSLADKTFGKMKLERYKTGALTGQSLDKKYLFGYEMDSVWTRQKLFYYDVITGKKSGGIKFNSYASFAQQTSPSGKLIAFSTAQGNSIFVCSFPEGKALMELKGHTGYVMGLSFSQDDKRLMSASMDGTKRLWNLQTGKEIATIIDINKDDYAIITPDQYYYCTKGASRLIHFVKDLKIYPFESFDLKYNRPDIIMQRLEASNIELEKSFRYAHEKRIKKMGFTEEQLSGEMTLPVVEITNNNEIPIDSKSDKIKVKLKLKDEKYLLDHCMVRVNGVPLFGIRGIDLRQKKSKQFEEELEIALSDGKNKIEITVMNEKGTESIVETAEVNYEGKHEKPTLYLVAYGASKYKDARFNLNYATKDAENVADLFKGDEIFKEVKTLLLENENATVGNLGKIKEFLKQSSINDEVIVFVAGHGVLDQNLDYYLATYDMNFENPSEKGLAYEKLEEVLTDIPARNKMLLLDACHSGEVDKEEMALVTTTNNNNNNSPGEKIAFRAMPNVSVKKVGLNNSFELMKEMFTDLRKGNGTIVVSSAGGAEYAMEGGQWNNGVFTYSILKGLKDKKADLDGDGKIMMSELQKYLQTEVPRLTEGKQKPTSRVENLSTDWRVW